MKVKISLLEDIKDAPWDLLLLADPSSELIEEYLSRGQCFVTLIHDEIVGVFVLIRTRPETMELVNVAVRDDFQGKGIGKQLVLSAIDKAKEQGAKTIEIGTGTQACTNSRYIRNVDFASLASIGTFSFGIMKKRSMRMEFSV